MGFEPYIGRNQRYWRHHEPWYYVDSLHNSISISLSVIALLTQTIDFLGSLPRFMIQEWDNTIKMWIQAKWCCHPEFLPVIDATCFLRSLRMAKVVDTSKFLSSNMPKLKPPEEVEKGVGEAPKPILRHPIWSSSISMGLVNIPVRHWSVQDERKGFTGAENRPMKPVAKSMMEALIGRQNPWSNIWNGRYYYQCHTCLKSSAYDDILGKA
jgi:hypothetical protein